MTKKEYIEHWAFDIELQNLVREYNKECESDRSSGAFEALYRLRLFPTADVVEVVRCNDCKHLTVHNSPTLYAYCEKTKYRFEPFRTDTRTHYCSYGERKEE